MNKILVCALTVLLLLSCYLPAMATGEDGELSVGFAGNSSLTVGFGVSSYIRIGFAGNITNIPSSHDFGVVQPSTAYWTGSSGGGGGSNLVTEQLLVAGERTSLSPTTVKYNNIVGGGSWNTDSIYSTHVISTPGVIRDLAVSLSIIPGTGKSYTFALMKNDVAQSLSVTIADTSYHGTDYVNEVAVVPGDYVTLRCTPSGTPTASLATWSMIFQSENPNESLLTSIGDAYKLDTEYSPIMIGSGSWEEPYTYQVIPTSGKIKDLYAMLLEGDPGTAPDAYKFTLRKNGGNTTLTCTITADNITGNDTAHEVSVAAGDLVNWMVEPLNTPGTSGYCAISATFEADTNGESLLLGQSSQTPSLDATEYNILVSASIGRAWTNDEPTRYQLAQSGFTFRNFYAWMSGTASEDYVLKLRNSGADSGIVITIPAGYQSGNDTAHTYSTGYYDSVDLSVLAKDTARHLHWGMVCYKAPYYPDFPLTDDNCFGNITNNSSFAVNISAYAGNMTGGNTYVLVSGVPGEDEFRLTTYQSGDDEEDGLVLTWTAQSWITGLGAGNSTLWDLKFETWSSNTDGAEKTCIITFEAEAS